MHGYKKVRNMKERDLPPKVYRDHNTYRVVISFRDKQKAINFQKRMVKEGLISQERRNFHNFEDRYLRKNPSGTFTIQKVINNHKETFGTYKKIHTAREARDFWESINWDFDLLDLY